jgi:hypothetical protein
LPLALSSVFLERVRVETMLLLAPNALLLRSPHLDGPSSSRTGWNALLSGFVTLASPWPWCKEEWCQLGGAAGATMRKRSVMSVVGSEVHCADWECSRQDLFGSPAPTDADADAWKGEETFVAKMVHRHQARWKGLLPGPKENAAFAQSQVQVDDVEVRASHRRLAWRRLLLVPRHRALSALALALALALQHWGGSELAQLRNCRLISSF